VPPLAFKFAEYVEFNAAFGSVDVVIKSEALAIVIEKVPVAMAPLESVTVTETGTSCAVDGKPVIAPEAEMLRPSPALPENVYPPAPPLAENAPEYGWPTCPGGSVALICSAAGFTVTEKLCDAVNGGVWLSVAVTLNVNTPVPVTVPLNVAVEESNEVPGGRSPDVENL
jgi:hypothetical protein